MSYVEWAAKRAANSNTPRTKDQWKKEVLRIYNRPGFMGNWNDAVRQLAEEDKEWDERQKKA